MDVVQHLPVAVALFITLCRKGRGVVLLQKTSGKLLRFDHMLHGFLFCLGVNVYVLQFIPTCFFLSAPVLLSLKTYSCTIESDSCRLLCFHQCDSQRHSGGK